jgi:hypothetical protein
MPAAVRGLLDPYRVPGGMPDGASGPLLGIGTPHRLTARPGVLLSDHLLLLTPIVAQNLRDTAMADVALGEEWITHMHRVLYSQLYRGELTLDGLRWPLSPVPTSQPITADMLPSWQLDLATDFTRLVSTDVFLCDLRAVSIAATDQGQGQKSPTSGGRRRPASWFFDLGADLRNKGIDPADPHAWSQVSTQLKKLNRTGDHHYNVDQTLLAMKILAAEEAQRGA